MIKKYLNILFYMFSFIFIYYLLVSGTNYEILPSLLIMVIIFIDIAMYIADEYESSIITEKQKAAVYLKDLENQKENVEAIEQRNLETERRNHDLKKNIKTEKSRLFIDLAVPPDIDENIPKISGVRLINIDCIKQLANENNALKLDSVESAKEIIFEEIEVLKKDLAFHEFLPCMQSVKNAMPSDFSEKFIYKLKSDVSAEEFARILEIYRKCGENN